MRFPFLISLAIFFFYDFYFTRKFALSVRLRRTFARYRRSKTNAASVADFCVCDRAVFLCDLLHYTEYSFFLHYFFAIRPGLVLSPHRQIAIIEIYKWIYI